MWVTTPSHRNGQRTAVGVVTHMMVMFSVFYYKLDTGPAISLWVVTPSHGRTAVGVVTQLQLGAAKLG